jgi:hypothetical protein
MDARFAASLALCLGVAAPAVPGVAAAQRFEYSPGTTQYRITVTSSGAAENMGQQQSFSFGSNQRMTMTLVKHGSDTLAYTMTIDSISGTMPTGQPIDGSKAVGMKVTAMLSPVGKVYSSVLPPLDAGREVLGPAAEEMAHFLPVVPSDLKIGSAWTDTIARPVHQPGIEIKRTVVTSWKVVGDTTYGDERAWRLDRSATTTLAGEGTTMGQPITLEGGASGTGTLYISQRGRYLGADLKDEVKQKATLVAQGMNVTSTVTQLTKVAALK